MTYAFQITVYYVARVEVVKTVRHVPQLRNLKSECSDKMVTVEMNPPTRSRRSTSGFFLTYSVILPCSIQWQTISNGGNFVGTPMKGTMLGCCNLFHTTTSLKNVCRSGWFSDGCGGRRKRKNLFGDSPNVLSVRPQRLDTDLFPIKFRFVYVSKTSSRDRLPPARKPFTRNDVGVRQNLAAAADTLQST